MLNHFARPSIQEYDKSEIPEEIKSRINNYIHYGNMAIGSAEYPYMPASRRQRYRFLRRLWDGTVDETDYLYALGKFDKHIRDEKMDIDQVVTLELPAKIRHIPLVRPKIQALVSKEKRNRKEFSVYAIDEQSTERKKKAHIQEILQKEKTKVMARLEAYRMLVEAKALKEQMMQKMQETGNPEMAADARVLQYEIQQIEKELKQNVAMSDKELDLIHKMFKMKYKDIEELMQELCLKNYISKFRLDYVINNSFQEHMITGDPIMFVDWEPGNIEPFFRNVNPENIWYQTNDNSTFLHELDWICEYRPMIMSHVLNLWPAIPKDEVEKLSALNSYRANVWPETNLNHFPNGESVVWSNTMYNEMAVDCYSVYWKEKMDHYALLEYGNMEQYYTDKPTFVDFISEEEYKDYMRNPSKLKDRKLKIEKRYSTELFKGVRLGMDVFPEYGLKSFQPYVDNQLTNVCLPYVGYAINRYHQPFSPLWETRELQQLYDLLYYRFELLLNLSGVRGIVYDLAQKPENMELQEVMYYMSQGIMPISSIRDGKPVQFNQFTTYDLTLSPTISALFEAMQQIERMVSAITGMNDQQTGQMAGTEKVGVTEMALEQSNIVTEYYFQRHEQLVEIALTMLCNAFPHAYKDGRTSSFDMDGEFHSLNLPKDSLTGVYRTVVKNGFKERELKTLAKDMAIRAVDKGMMPMHALLSMLDKDSTKDMIGTLEMYEEKFKEMQERQSSNELNMQKELMQMDAQMQERLAGINANMLEKIEVVKGQIKQQHEQLKSQLEAKKMELKAQADKENVQVKREEIQSEADVEREYLEFQKHSLQVQEEHQRRQMVIHAVRDKMELQQKKEEALNKQRSKNRIKD